MAWYWQLLCWVAIIALVAGRFRRHVLRSELRIEEGARQAEGTSVSVLMIHGTFARRAPWTQSGSPFEHYLLRSFGPCSVDTLLWSGDNSHIERNAAARLAQEWIDHSPARYVYLIGHSHGGCIAAIGASRASRKDVQVVTLSSPFIHIKPRNGGFTSHLDDSASESDKVRMMFAVETLLVLLAGLVLISSSALNAAFFIVVVAWQTIAATVFRERTRRVLVQRLERLQSGIGEFSLSTEINLESNRLLVLRTTNDEATGLLAASAFSSWAMHSTIRVVDALLHFARKVERAIGERFDFVIPATIFGLLITFGLLKASQSAAMLGTYLIEYFGNTLVAIIYIGYAARLRALTVCIEALCFVASAPVFMALAVPFGLEVGIRAPLLRISAEVTPPGSWRMITLRAANDFLAHSEIYQRPEVADALTALHRRVSS